MGDKEKLILVASTVIEVGITQASLGCLIVVNAERFGVAQLHQLRGRVSSFCARRFKIRALVAVQAEEMLGMIHIVGFGRCLRDTVLQNVVILEANLKTARGRVFQHTGRRPRVG